MQQAQRDRHSNPLVVQHAMLPKPHTTLQK
jgi:hypothetical protein